MKTKCSCKFGLVMVTGMQSYCPKLFRRRETGRLRLLRLCCFLQHSPPCVILPIYLSAKQPLTPICKEQWVKGYQLTEIPGTIDKCSLLKSIHFSAVNVANKKKISIRIAYDIQYVKSSALLISSMWFIPLTLKTLELHSSISDHIPELLEAACSPVKLQ